MQTATVSQQSLPTYEQLMARVTELEAKNAAALVKAERKANTFSLGNKLTGRVSEKGGFSVYGLGKWPVTLYFEQWVRLLNSASAIMTVLYAAKAAGKLSVKADDDAETPTVPADVPSDVPAIPVQ